MLVRRVIGDSDMRNWVEFAAFLPKMLQIALFSALFAAKTLKMLQNPIIPEKILIFAEENQIRRNF